MGTLLRLAVAAAWLTFGLGLLPVLVYVALGLLLFLPFPEVGRHLLRLALRAASPLGTRVCDRQGRGVLRLVPVVGALWAAEAVEGVVDPHGDLADCFDDSGRPARSEATLNEDSLEGIVFIAWVLLAGWELAIAHAVIGVLLCLTVVGAVFGVRHLALVPVAIYPPGFFVLRAGEPLPPRPRFRLRGARDGGTATAVGP